MFLVERIRLHNHLFQLIRWVTVDAVLLKTKEHIKIIRQEAMVKNTHTQECSREVVETHWWYKRGCSFLLFHLYPINALKESQFLHLLHRLQPLVLLGMK